jgi:hypothetical protein
MNSGAAFSQIRRVIDLERRCFFSARWRGDIFCSQRLYYIANRAVNIGTQFWRKPKIKYKNGVIKE